MGEIIAAMASSHAYAFLEPSTWDKQREHTWSNYFKRYGTTPSEHPQVARETLEENEQRFQSIRTGLELLRQQVHELAPDTLILIGDDQDENYHEDNLPQFSIYIGDHLGAVDRNRASKLALNCDSDLARALLTHSVDAGFDVAYSKSFPNDELRSHAHQQPLAFLQAHERCKVVPIFVNAIHVPGPSPRRCFEFGEVLRRAIEAEPSGKRVVLYASGGWSHFTAGYPWGHYEGPHSLGSISEEFDRRLLEHLRNGETREWSRLSSRDLLDHGDVELRQWLVLLGAVGEAKPRYVAYEPFFRGVMGMGVALWEPVSNASHSPVGDGKGV
jgi:aromatic ring-opening dioxygenase LigB subunit